MNQEQHDELDDVLNELVDADSAWPEDIMDKEQKILKDLIKVVNERLDETVEDDE